MEKQQTEGLGFKEFEEWRSHSLFANDYYCKTEEVSKIGESQQLSAKIANFHKCMLQLTREMCRCDQKCVTESLMNVTLDFPCLKIDHDNLFLSMKYQPCDMYGIKVLNGSMYYRNTPDLFPVLGERIYNELFKLCNENKKISMNYNVA